MPKIDGPLDKDGNTQPIRSNFDISYLATFDTSKAMFKLDT
jgi:hypothetical protein